MRAAECTEYDASAARQRAAQLAAWACKLMGTSTSGFGFADASSKLQLEIMLGRSQAQMRATQNLETCSCALSLTRKLIVAATAL